jgi:hypoxanthine phosphoribosyltransferase
VRCIDRRIEIDFVALSAFAPDSGRIRLTRDIAADVTDRQVVLVEGVVDTGFRVDFLRRHLVGHCTSEVRVCTLFDRSDRRVLPVQVDHAGFVFDEGFVVGYGLDHQGLYRNLSSVVAVDLTALEAEHRAGRTEMTDEVLRLAGSGADAGPEEGSRVPA